MGKSKRSKATEISKEVRALVYERDNMSCVVCGKHGAPNAHYIRRAHGGKGVEKNVVTLCNICHHDFDNGSKRREIGDIILNYLLSLYPDWEESPVIYQDENWTRGESVCGSEACRMCRTEAG